MRWPALVASHSQPTASRVLGVDHPLARAIDECESTARQCRAVAAVMVGCILPVAAGRAWAQALVVAATAVLVTLILILASRYQARRDRALELICDGHENTAVEVVQCQRRRLERQGTCTALARALEDIADQACRRPRPRQLRPLPPLFDYRMIRSLRQDVREVADLLRDGEVRASGVARIERLITHGCSPLYGHERERLRVELDQARRLLVDDPASRDQGSMMPRRMA